jgi:hypothetical protein
LYKLIDPSNPKSQEEWAKQAGVRAVKPKMLPDGGESDTVEVHASFEKEEVEFSDEMRQTYVMADLKRDRLLEAIIGTAAEKP